MLQADIRAALIDRLAPIFGKPRDPDFLASELVRHIPAGVTIGDLSGLADRIVATRKTRGFPVASELITAVKALRSTASIATGVQDDGTIRFAGAAPVTWVPADDPRFGELCRLEQAAAKARGAINYRVGATTSKYAKGLGWYFPTSMVDALPLTNDERLSMRARRNPQPIIERVARGLSAFVKERRHAVQPEDPTPVAPGEGPYAQALRKPPEGE